MTGTAPAEGADPPDAAEPQDPSPPRGAEGATARGGWFALLGSAVNAVSGFALVALVSHGAGAAGTGALFTGIAVFTVLGNACKLGADTALVRFVARDLALTGGGAVRGLLRTALLPSCALATATAVVLALAPGLAPRLMPDLAATDARHLMVLFAVFLPVATAGLVVLAASRGHGSVLAFVTVEQIGKPLARTALTWAALVWAAPGAVTLGAAWLAPTALGTAAAWLFLRGQRRARPAVPQLPPPKAEFWAFARPRALASLFDIAAVWIGVPLLALSGSGTEAGVYTAVTRLVTAATLWQLAVRLAVAPRIGSLLATGEHRAAQRLHGRSTTWIALFSWPVLALLALFPHTALALFGAGFASGAPALTVLALCSLVNVGVGNAQTLLLMAGRSRDNLAVAAAAFAVQVGLGLWWAPRWGALGAAAAWGAAVVTDNLAAAALARWRLGFRTVDRGYRAAVAAAGWTVAVAGVVRCLGGDTPGGAVPAIPLSITAFAGAMWRYREALGAGTLLGALRRGRAPDS
ncbi:lipopolysaccharide biosynthesis protein [Streptomyces sp. NPDC059740]|uniref:lipopolysaccharide biosynthesis protein n=1 Tax=Streptomyces sp. NPDC059740 TaxID=3346926 RepID=UPI0036546D6C